MIALGCAVWTLLFAWPVLFVRARGAACAATRARSFWRSTSCSGSDIKRALARSARHDVWFLLASAVFRDGLAGVFAFGAVIAAVVFHFSSNEV